LRKPKTLRVRLISLALALSIGVTLLAAMLIANGKGYYIAINDNYSFPNRIYLAREITPDERICSDGRFKRGSLVIFRLDDRLSDTPYQEKLKNRDLFKEVVCLEGDYLQKVENRFICNNEEVAIARPNDSEGKPYAVSFDYDGVIPEGLLFVTAPHYMSFDSRYFGFVEVKAVKGEILWAIY
jgi:type IV secretory pathway protease TraF